MVRNPQKELQMGVQVSWVVRWKYKAEEPVLVVSHPGVDRL